MAGTEQSQYYISSAVLSTERSQNGCSSIEIANLIVELQLFEDIRLPFTTGIVLVGDPDHVLDLAGFSGTEKLELTVNSSSSANSNSITKKYFIKQVSAKLKDKSVYVFNLVEEAGFMWGTTQIFKSYKGKMEDILYKIIQEKMNLEVDNFLMDMESAQNEIVYQPRGKSLKEIIPHLSQNMCTTEGYPYFVYGTLFDKKIKLATLDWLFNEDSFNCQPFVYAPMYMKHMIEQGNLDLQAYSIIQVDTQKDLSDYRLYGENKINYDLHTINVDDGTDKPVYIDPLTQKNMMEFFTTSKSQVQTTFNNNTEVKMNDLKIWDVCRGQSTIFATSNQLTEPDDFTFGERNRKPAIDGVPVELLVQYADTFRHFMSSNMITIVTPGTALFDNRVTVGMTTDLVFSKQNENETIDGRDIEDKKLTGKYIITNIKHQFMNQKHVTQLNVVKFTEEQI